jgi:hypothetical protein
MLHGDEFAPAIVQQFVGVWTQIMDGDDDVIHMLL